MGFYYLWSNNSWPKNSVHAFSTCVSPRTAIEASDNNDWVAKPYVILFHWKNVGKKDNFYRKDVHARSVTILVIIASYGGGTFLK